MELVGDARGGRGRGVGGDGLGDAEKGEDVLLVEVGGKHQKTNELSTERINEECFS